MRRAAKTLGGLIAGFVVGSLLLDGPVAAMFAPATVTWNATDCPLGTYTLTSTATSLNGGGTFETTSHDVRLPAATVTQFFEHLPEGRFAVTAVLTNENGETVGSDSQLLVVTPPSVRAPKPQALASRAAAERTSTPVSRTSPPVSRPSVGPAKIAGNQSTLVLVDRPAMSRAALADLLGDLPDVRQLDLIDQDDDGEIDLLRILWLSGAVREWRVVR